MSGELIGYVSIGALVILLGLGMPVAFAMALIGFAGYIMLRSFDQALGILSLTPLTTLTVYGFTVIPLFVLMGMAAYRADFGADVFFAARHWVGRIRGSLAIATTLGCAAFGTIAGDAISSTVTIGKVALPEMDKAGYDRKLALGALAASGPIASMIPPSVIMVILGMITEQSVGTLLMAGLLPGITTAVIFSLTTYLRALRSPKLAPISEEGTPWKDKFKSLVRIWAIVLCALLIWGGLYSGLATPTELGGLAALIILAAGIIYRRLNLGKIWDALLDTARVAGMLAAILVGAFLYNYMFALTGIVPHLADVIIGSGLPPTGIVILIMALFLFLGTFMNAIAMVYLAMPFVYPIVVEAGINPIWFLVLVVHTAEMGCITPPFGLTLFAARSIAPAGTTTTMVIRGIGPFVLAGFVVLAILIAFPQIALFLPNLMR